MKALNTVLQLQFLWINILVMEKRNFTLAIRSDDLLSRSHDYLLFEFWGMSFSYKSINVQSSLSDDGAAGDLYEQLFVNCMHLIGNVFIMRRHT